MWTGAGLVFAALTIPIPLYAAAGSGVQEIGGPVQTIFTGHTAGENAVAACSLALLALPLAVTGLARGRMATVMVVAWLPEAAFQLLGYYVFPAIFHLSFNAWYYVSWIAWLVIAALAFAEARDWGARSERCSR